MLKLKFQYFGHLMQRTDSLEKTLTLGKIEDRRRRGRQRKKCLDGITDVDMRLSNLREVVMYREGWCAVVLGVKKSQTQLSDWTELRIIISCWFCVTEPRANWSCTCDVRRSTWPPCRQHSSGKDGWVTGFQLAYWVEWGQDRAQPPYSWAYCPWPLPSTPGHFWPRGSLETGQETRLHMAKAGWDRGCDGPWLAESTGTWCALDAGKRAWPQSLQFLGELLPWQLSSRSQGGCKIRLTFSDMPCWKIHLTFPPRCALERKAETVHTLQVRLLKKQQGPCTINAVDRHSIREAQGKAGWDPQLDGPCAALVLAAREQRSTSLM